jgi:hypothetical protein
MSDELLPIPADPATSGVFQGLARLVYASDDYSEVFEAVVRAAPDLVQGCDHASLMMRRNGRYTTAASSDEIAELIDSFELELGEGPCLDAIIDEAVFHDDDLTDGSPWPRLTARVLAETPVRGMAGFRIIVDEKKTGALNLFSDQAGALDQHSIDQGIVLASFVSVAMLAADERQAANTLRDGLKSNREIGKAIGLMMAFHKISDADAFDMLRVASQEMNLKLSEVARQVVEHHNRV